MIDVFAVGDGIRQCWDLTSVANNKMVLTES